MRYRVLATVLLLVAAAWLAAACDPLLLNVEPTPTATVVPSNTPAPTDTALPLPSDTPVAQATVGGGTPGTDSTAPDIQKLEQQLRDIERDTSDLRGLQPKSPVKEHFITAAEMKANLADEVKSEYSPEEGHRDAHVLWLLRLLDDPSIDLYQLQIDLLGEQVLGYYDQEKKELFVKTEPGGLSPLGRETLSHEFVHNLQDQYFDLMKLHPRHMENDKGTAVVALIEGDASVSGILYAQKYMSPQDFQSVLSESSSSSSEVLDKAPPYMRTSLLFPYEQGPIFITALARNSPGSFKGINDALSDPPVSTEQLLHPEKYLGAVRDNPKEVTLQPLTATLGAGWTFQDTDTLGEFDFQQMFSVNSAGNDEAAAGWGGARYAYYSKGNDGIVLMDSVWDTDKDAGEFNAALVSSLSSFKKDGSLWTDGKRYVALKTTPGRVAYVAGTDRAAVEKVAAAVKP